MTTKSPPAVYVDITQLMDWRGHLTGILRVMDEFAIRFRRDYPNAVFIAWDTDLALYRYADFEEATTWHEKAEPLRDGPEAPRRLLSKVKGRAGQAVKGVNPELHRAIKRSMARSKERGTYREVQFEPNDTLFITWGEWSDEAFVSKVEAWCGEGLNLVHVIHDMGPIVVPQFSGSGDAAKSFPFYCEHLLPICSLILVNSEFSKRAVVDWLHENKLKVPPVGVFRLGEDFRIATAKEPTDPEFVRSQVQGNDFILFVGTMEIKKNHTLLYYVYKLAKARGVTPPKLLVVGRLGWRMETMEKVIQEDPETKDSIFLLQHIDDQGLTWLYERCLFTVQASFYEGWGIPVAESLARGVPAICSNSSSMVEIADDGIVSYFTPTSTDECLAAIEHLLRPAELEEAKKRVAQYKTFSWDDCFEQVKKYMEALR